MSSWDELSDSDAIEESRCPRERVAKNTAQGLVLIWENETDELRRKGDRVICDLERPRCSVSKKCTVALMDVYKGKPETQRLLRLTPMTRHAPVQKNYIESQLEYVDIGIPLKGMKDIRRNGAVVKQDCEKYAGCRSNLASRSPLPPFSLHMR